MSAPRRQRILSGMQPTGRMHIGGYLGALENWVRLQDDYECFFFIADYHALTTVTEPRSIRPSVNDLVLDWLAAGLDPERSVIFVQSDVPEVAELHLLFSMVTPVSWLERVPTYKERIEQFPENVNYGLLGYPVLQAADILLYQGERVPVGEDQLPHLELTRELARRFNHTYGRSVFVEPQAILSPTPRVPGTDGSAKMSKSRGNVIELTAPPEEVRAAVMRMVTDVLRPRRTDPGHPASCNVCQLHRILSPGWEGIWEGERSGRTGCVDTKNLLADTLVARFAPLRERRAELEAAPQTVRDILADGARRARRVARRTLREAREATGMGAARRPAAITPSR